MPLPTKTWNPQHLVAVGRSYDTSVGTTEVETDAGRAYIKPMGNRSGPHVLAAEWVATHLAQWFGLPTFEVNLLILGDSDVFPLPRNFMAAPGPAFVAREMKGRSWARTADDLDTLINPDDVTRLVVFDTWVLNCDRHPPDLNVRKPNYDNVYFAATDDPEKWRLIASDHTHCFTCGRDLTATTANIDRVQDDRLYGFFPGFVGRIHMPVIEQCCEKLRTLAANEVTEIVDSIPAEWEVDNASRAAMQELVLRRSTFVADNIPGWIIPPR